MAAVYTKGMLYTIGTKVSTIVLGTLSSVMIVRTLGPEQYGVYTYISLVVGLACIFANFRLGSSNAYFLASGKYGPDLLKRISLVSATLTGGTAGIVSLLFLFNRDSVCHLALWPPIIIAATIPLTISNEYMTGILRGLTRFGAFNIAKTAGSVFRFVVVGMVFLWTRTFLTVELIVVLDAVMILSVWLFIFRVTSKGKAWAGHSSHSSKKGTAREIHTYGWLTFVYILIISLNGKVDRVIITSYLDVSALGCYTISVRLAEVIWIIYHSVQDVLLPKLAGSSTEQRVKNVIFINEVSIFFLLACAVAMIVFGRMVITLMYGDEFLDAVRPFQVLVTGTTAYSLHKLFATYYLSIGRLRTVIMISLAGLVGNIFLTVLLVPKYGLTGASLGTTLSYLGSTAAIIYLFLKETNRPLKDLFVPSAETYSVLFSKIKSIFTYKK